MILKKIHLDFWQAKKAMPAWQPRTTLRTTLQTTQGTNDMTTNAAPTNAESMAHLLHLEKLEKLAMNLAQELQRHTEQYAEGYLSYTLAAQHKAANLERRIKEVDQAADAIRESL